MRKLSPSSSTKISGATPTSEFDSPDVDNEVRIEVRDDLHLRIGDFTTVLITGATSFDLDPEVVEENG